MVLGCEGDKFRVLAQRVRHVPQKGMPDPSMEGAVSKTDHGDYPYSRSLVRKALDEGVGLLSEDGEANLPKTATLMALNLKSFLCVPLLGQGGEKMGVIQLDCLRPGRSFKHDDLELLTAVALQTAVVLENAVLHEQRLREESLRRELALAREIQQSFLPRNFKPVDGDYDLFAQVVPAHGVSGDLYDIFPLPDGRLALFVGDVSGKGMPAALFMIAVHTLTRHLAGSIRTPGGMLQELNAALVADNPTSLFVTLTHAIYDPRTGELAVSSGGHLPPLLRRSNGLIESIKVPAHLMLGYMPFEHPPAEVRLTLQPGETFVLYTDGLIEAFPADRKSMFGVERLTETLAGLDLALPLPEWANRVREAIAKFTGLTELQDDQTMLLLRRT
jgi:serine phosphatase RsbU (regulator of sigma subunit)